MERLFSDIRYAFRGLLKRRTFAIVAVIILALGIGATTAIFTLMDAVLLKRLPVSMPDELVLFSDSAGEGTSSTSSSDLPSGRWRYFSYPSYRYFRDHDQSYQALSAIRSGESRVSVRSVNAQSGEATQRAWSHLVSGIQGQ